MKFSDAILTLVSAVALGMFYYFMALSKKSPVKTIDKSGEFRMPDTRFHNTPAKLYAAFDKAGEAGRPLMRRYWLLDFGLMAGLLGVMYVIALNLAGEGTALFLLMNLVAAVRTVFDVGENLSFLLLLRVYPKKKNGAAAFAGVMTAVKSVCLYVWIGMLFYYLFASAFGIGK